MNKNTKSIEDQLQELKHIELKYKALLNTIPTIAWFSDKDSNYIDVNSSFLIHCGKTLDDIKGKDHKYVWDRKTGDECRKNDLLVLNKKEPLFFQEVVPGKKGYRRLNIYRFPVLDDNGEVIGITAVARDVTSIENRDTQLKTLIENIPFKVWLLNKNGDYINANSKFAASKKTTVEQLIGRNIKEFYKQEELDTIFNEDKEVIDKQKTIKFTKRLIHGSEKRTLEVYKTPVFDIGGELVGIVGILIDITKIQQTKDKMKKQAYTDPHTGLLNRRALYKYIKHRFNGNKISIMVIDVDDFKHINDTYGHLIGDTLLEKVSKTLKQICPKDFIFRFGGDEFIILSISPANIEYIEEKAQNILAKVSCIKTDETKNETINISIGVALCDCNKDKCNYSNCKLLSRADIALFKAKEYGKNQYVIYTKILEDEINLKLNIESALKLAVQNNEIMLYYQPQYTKEKKLVGFEALFRWKNNKYSHVPILDLIKIIEESNLILSIGKEIIRKSCLFSNKINKNRKEKLVVSFNVSSIQIMNTNFVKEIKEILNETQVCADCIGIEITETVLLENINENIEKIKILKNLGIKISLDDFGTGYSSLNYLVKLPLSVVKIDRSFIVDMENSQEYVTLVKLIIEISHTLNFEIIAEGVENEKQYNMLKEMGVDYIQGYLFSKPLNESEALKLINKREI
ncbi:sensor domain-containing protein [Romboutsia sp.]|uniref:sensor domain-containing protein n=1 Tax=Romboutsia sp. TaxID=1965302 RepID=UPI003F2FEEA0